MNFDAIVAGAGPAGSSAAFFLAERGRRVLLIDRGRFPRDKSCGDGLTLPAVRVLAEMGVLDRLSGCQQVAGARVFMRGKGSRDFLYPAQPTPTQRGLVVPRHKLDAVICARAVEAGAQLWEKTLVTTVLREAGRVTGIEVNRDGQTEKIFAPAIVAADGAASRLAAKAGMARDVSQRLGFALRGYFHGVAGLTELLELYMPLIDITDRYVLPSYGWVFPTGPDTANIGVGIFERTAGITVRTMIKRFIADLRERDDRFANMELRGSLMGAPLNFEFRADCCTVPGLLLVGDAAGLVSPFTGEGISYALESGKIAAEAIDRNLKPGCAAPDFSDYGLMLERRYMGYFEAGRQGARRHRLIWHILESTFHNEKPLFALCRKAALLPEAVGETDPATVLDDVSALVERGGLSVREDLLAVGETLIATVRQDWPFLARFHAGGHGDPGIPFRPALLLLLAAATGNSDERRIQAAAAIELGYAAALAHVSVENATALDSQTNQNGQERPANWGNMLALLAGDFFLSKAYAISVQCGVTISQMIADSLGTVCQARMRAEQLAHGHIVADRVREEIAIGHVATLFELPCRLGALIGGLDERQGVAMTLYGRNLGLAFHYADQVLALQGRASELGKVIAGASPVSGGPQSESAAWQYAERAIEHAACLTDCPAQRTLVRLARYAVDRERGDAVDLRALLET